MTFTPQVITSAIVVALVLAAAAAGYGESKRSIPTALLMPLMVIASILALVFAALPAPPTSKSPAVGGDNFFHNLGPALRRLNPTIVALEPKDGVTFLVGGAKRDHALAMRLSNVSNALANEIARNTYAPLGDVRTVIQSHHAWPIDAYTIAMDPRAGAPEPLDVFVYVSSLTPETPE